MDAGINELPNRQSLISLLPPNSIGCEVGVAKGEFSKILLKSNPAKLHLIDIWDSTHPHASKNASYERVAKRFEQEIASGQVTIHHEDLFKVIPTFDDNYFDWLYLDAWHFYNEIKSQIELCLPKLKQGGILAGHDYQVVPKTHSCGVLRAVTEAVQDGLIKLIAFTNEKTPDWVSIKL